MVHVDRKELEHLYVVKKMTTRQIAPQFGVSPRTIARKLREYDIDIRPPGPNRHRRLRSRWWLYRQYIDLGKPTTQIADEIGASSCVVYGWLTKHGIPTRPAGASLKGKKMGDEGRRKMSVARRGRYVGPDNPNWKGGYVDPTYSERRSYKAKRWQASVKKRDSHACRHCGAKDVRLHAHHIKPWRSYPEHRFDVSNGLTLCVPCHEKEHGFSFSAYDKRQDEKPRVRDTQSG